MLRGAGTRVHTRRIVAGGPGFPGQARPSLSVGSRRRIRRISGRVLLLIRGVGALAPPATGHCGLLHREALRVEQDERASASGQARYNPRKSSVACFTFITHTYPIVCSYRRVSIRRAASSPIAAAHLPATSTAPGVHPSHRPLRRVLLERPIHHRQLAKLPTAFRTWLCIRKVRTKTTCCFLTTSSSSDAGGWSRILSALLAGTKSS
jgi:hypothetical protein